MPVQPVIYQKRCSLAVLLFKLLWLRRVRKKKKEKRTYLLLFKKRRAPLHFNVFLLDFLQLSALMFFFLHIFYIIHAVSGYSSFVCLLICLRPSSALHLHFFPSPPPTTSSLSLMRCFEGMNRWRVLKGDTWNPYLRPTPAHLKSTTGPFCDNQYMTPPNIIWRVLCVDRSFRGFSSPTLTSTLAHFHSPRSLGGHHHSVLNAHTDWWALRRGFF